MNLAINNEEIERAVQADLAPDEQVEFSCRKKKFWFAQLLIIMLFIYVLILLFQFSRGFSLNLLSVGSFTLVFLFALYGTYSAALPPIAVTLTNKQIRLIDEKYAIKHFSYQSIKSVDFISSMRTIRISPVEGEPIFIAGLDEPQELQYLIRSHQTV